MWKVAAETKIIPRNESPPFSKDWRRSRFMVLAVKGSSDLSEDSRMGTLQYQ
jgi:hypothetical protein